MPASMPPIPLRAKGSTSVELSTPSLNCTNNTYQTPSNVTVDIAQQVKKVDTVAQRLLTENQSSVPVSASTQSPNENKSKLVIERANVDMKQHCQLPTQAQEKKSINKKTNIDQLHHNHSSSNYVNPQNTIVNSTSIEKPLLKKQGQSQSDKNLPDTASASGQDKSSQRNDQHGSVDQTKDQNRRSKNDRRHHDKRSKSPYQNKDLSHRSIHKDSKRRGKSKSRSRSLSSSKHDRHQSRKDHKSTRSEHHKRREGRDEHRHRSSLRHKDEPSSHYRQDSFLDRNQFRHHRHTSSESQQSNDVARRDDKHYRKRSHRHHHHHRRHRDYSRSSSASVTSRKSSKSRSPENDRHRKRHGHKSHRTSTRETERRHRSSRRGDSDEYNDRYRKDDRRSRRARDERKNRDRDHQSNHPYFQNKKKSKEEEEDERWDGFQWVQRSRCTYDPMADHVDRKMEEVTGANKEENQERVAASKTVIIENIALDLGLTSRDVQTFLLKSLSDLGITNVEIIDCDIEYGQSSVAVELRDKSMIDQLKKLNGVLCLGEPLKVRKITEETTQTNVQASLIALTALSQLTGTANSELNTKASTLKTITQSNFIKIRNLCDRDAELTPEIYEELKEDLEDEMQHINSLRSIHIIRNGEEQLGAEVGSVFVEFSDKKGAEAAIKKLNGRVYDGLEIIATFLDEKIYQLLKAKF